MFNASIKYTGREKSSNLSEDALSLVHVLGFAPKVKSNRHRCKIFCKPYQINISKNF
jgi:hypothetical protein